MMTEVTDCDNENYDVLKIYLSSIKCITYRIHIIEEFDQASLEVGNTELIKKRELCRFLMP